jgi:hypothetical protein
MNSDLNGSKWCGIKSKGKGTSRIGNPVTASGTTWAPTSNVSSCVSETVLAAVVNDAGPLHSMRRRFDACGETTATVAAVVTPNAKSWPAAESTASPTFAKSTTSGVGSPTISKELSLV